MFRDIFSLRMSYWNNAKFYEACGSYGDDDENDDRGGNTETEFDGDRLLEDKQLDRRLVTLKIVHTFERAAIFRS